MIALEIIRTKSFDKSIKRYKKDKSTINRIKSQIKKLLENPESGDFLTGKKKGERKIYIGGFRLLYSYDIKKDTLYLLDFDKRSRIYKK